MDNYDYNIEKHYHPENFYSESEFENEEEINKWNKELQDKIDLYNAEIEIKIREALEKYIK